MPPYYCNIVFENKKGILDKFAEFCKIVNGKNIYFLIGENEMLELKKYKFQPSSIKICIQKESTKKFFNLLKENKKLEKYDIKVAEDCSNCFRISVRSSQDVACKEENNRILDEDLEFVFSKLNENQVYSIYLEKGGDGFYLRLVDEFPKIYFYYEYARARKTALEKNKEEALKIITKAIELTQPVLVYLTVNEGLINSYIEYYADPYYFCLEPEESIKEENKTIWYPFLKEENRKIDEKKLNEIKKVLPKNRLLEIIEKHSDKTVRVRENIIVFRKKIEDLPIGWRYVYPRYFVREEVRKLGVELPVGLAEIYYYTSNPRKFKKEILSLAVKQSENEKVRTETINGLNELAKHNPQRILPYFMKFFNDKSHWNWQSAIEYFLSILFKLKKIDEKKLQELIHASNFKENRKKVTEEAEKYGRRLGLE
jgi:hypothetical protein